MKRIGVYAGSFNPFHLGHLNIAQQARDVFDEVIIAIGSNPAKENIEKEQFPLLHPQIKGKFVVKEFVGRLLADFLNELEIGMPEDDKVFLIRGLRDGEDLHYEQNQLQFIREMYPSLKTVFFVCDRKYEHISSSALRQLKKISPDDYIKYVLENISGGVPRYPKYEGWRNEDASVNGEAGFQ